MPPTNFQRNLIYCFILVSVILWCFLIVLAPILSYLNQKFCAGAVYLFFSQICHQQSDRSFHIFDKPFAVCTRCSGVYFGFLLGTILLPLLKNRNFIAKPQRSYLLIALIPISIDYLLTLFNIWQNTFFTRFITGLILGSVTTIFIIPGLLTINVNKGGDYGEKTG